MRTAILAVLCLVVASSEAFAISRYQSQKLSCDSIQNKVAQEGAVILRYSSQRNPGLPLYDRYVESSQACGFREYAERDYVPASDTAQCPVLKCVPSDDDDFFFN